MNNYDQKAFELSYIPPDLIKIRTYLKKIGVFKQKLSRIIKKQKNKSQKNLKWKLNFHLRYSLHLQTLEPFQQASKTNSSVLRHSTTSTTQLLKSWPTVSINGRRTKTRSKNWMRTMQAPEFHLKSMRRVISVQRNSTSGRGSTKTTLNKSLKERKQRNWLKRSTKSVTITLVVSFRIRIILPRQSIGSRKATLVLSKIRVLVALVGPSRRPLCRRRCNQS